MQVRFTASVSGKPTPDINWYKADEIITPSKNVEITCNACLSTLIIKSVAAEHAGTYKVIASNEGGEISAEAVLNVEDKTSTPKTTQGSKPTITTKISDQSIEEGEDVSFKIEYEGQPNADIEWEKNGHKIVSIKRVKVIDGKNCSELKITGCRSDDAGTYTVSATNVHGMDACTVQLDVKSKLCAIVYLS